MLKPFKLVTAVIVGAMSFPASAAVSLFLSTPTPVVKAGEEFDVLVGLTASSEKVTGVDYYLTASLSGRFSIVGRTASPQFPDLVKQNVGDNGPNPGVLDANFAKLSPTSSLDLGASVANVSVPVGPGTFNVATLRLRVDSSASAGTYTISTSGSSWVGEAPMFPESGFSQNGSLQVSITAVPEPVLAAPLLSLFLLRRKRRANGPVRSRPHE